MVYDHYRPLFPDPMDWQRLLTIPLVSTPTPADMQKLIDEFKKATEAAKVVDLATGQPDCADPEKAKLEERVAALEAKIAEMERQKTEDGWKKLKRKTKRKTARK